jgi:hypothetical protein
MEILVLKDITTEIKNSMEEKQSGGDRKDP